MISRMWRSARRVLQNTIAEPMKTISGKLRRAAGRASSGATVNAI